MPQDINLLHKDAILNSLAQKFNVAQFISFSPTLEQRYSRINGEQDNNVFESTMEAVEAILQNSIDASVNIRSYHPEKPQSNEFIYGLNNAKDIFENLARLSKTGLYTIVNETISINDGGVSGVLQNGMVEFAPGVIPRFVENSDEQIATLEKKLAIALLQTVYGFLPNIDFPKNERIEFSIHPYKLGSRGENTIIWEQEKIPIHDIQQSIVWPTSFSKFIGDKAYGLLMANCLGFQVPKTTVFSRNPQISMFSFGQTTESSLFWTRTCPNTQVPGKFSTTKGLVNPHDLMNQDDPSGGNIPSCLCQQEVTAQYSGALITTADNGIIIEGVKGFGDSFMQGDHTPEDLPLSVLEDIKNTYLKIEEIFGPIRFEWAHDGKTVWILQLHSGKTKSLGKTIVPIPDSCINNVVFNVKEGLENLREKIDTIETNTAIFIKGNIGMSSHIADVLRKADIPSKILP